MRRIFSLSLYILFSATINAGWAVTPMEYYHSLVAGGDKPSFRDGTFSSARFRYPTGLAFDGSGNNLYVADSGNHRIRVVELDRDNVVKTLAGTGSIGAMDGPLTEATFNGPTELAALAGGRLAVFDSGNDSIRLIDLQKQAVSTIAKAVHILDMVYRPKDDSLYFSVQENKIEKLNMSSLAVSDVLSDNPQLPSPGALCMDGDRLCVADRNLPTVCEWDPARSSSGASAPFSTVGNARDVLALTSSDGHLYALRKGGLLVRVGLPDSSLVQFPTPWGFLFKTTDFGEIPFFTVRPEIPVGFLASPAEPRKFFITAIQSIISVKDYDFEKRWGAVEEGHHDDLTDFDYPSKKPARTFRILAAGASRNSQAFPLPSNPNGPVLEDSYGPRVYTFSKELEFLLNTEAALRNLNIHFEVLNFTNRAESISGPAYYDMPNLVKKYDIDLVLAMGDWNGYTDYYLRPMTPEGVPAKSADHSYSLKPLSARATSAVARDLLDRCKALKIPVSEKQDYPGNGYWSLFCNGDGRMQSDLREMTGRRLQLFQEKLGSMKTSGGSAPQFVIYYFPQLLLDNECVASFWSGVCAQYHLRFFDLTESYDALKNSYYPVCRVHLTAYGNVLVALILKNCLVENKLIPF